MWSNFVQSYRGTNGTYFSITSGTHLRTQQKVVIAQTMKISKRPWRFTFVLALY